MSTTITTIDVPTNSSRRNSTGTTVPTTNVTIPNYLRASIGGSCHDFCKFGMKPESIPILCTIHDQGKAAPVLLQEERTKNWKKGLSSDRLIIPMPVKKQATELKRKALGQNVTQFPVRQMNKTVVTTSLVNERTSRVEAARGVISSTRSSLQSHSSLPSSSFASPRLSVKALPAKSRTIKSMVAKASQLGIKNGVEKSPAKISSSKSTFEKPKAEKSSKGSVLENRIKGQQCSSSNENKKMDSGEERTVRGKRSGSVVTRENEASPRKLRFGKPRVVELQKQNASPLRISSRRVISNWEPTHTESHTIKAELRHSEVVQTIRDSHLMNAIIEETASRLIQKSMSKVKSLVGAFESVIKIHDFESLRRSQTL